MRRADQNANLPAPAGDSGGPQRPGVNRPQRGNLPAVGSRTRETRGADPRKADRLSAQSTARRLRTADACGSAPTPTPVIGGGGALSIPVFAPDVPGVVSVEVEDTRQLASL